MSLITQLQGVVYSFVFGLVFNFVYGFINRVFYKYREGIIRFILQIFIGISFGCIYYYGLLVINDGIIRIYFIISIIMGYIVYEHYYALAILMVIERLIIIIKKLLKPIYFIFRKFRAIMREVKKKVKKKWPRKKSLEQQSDLDQ